MAIRYLLYLLVIVAHPLLQGTFGAGHTFSSKLIHRFSDEARALWASKKFNVSEQHWPKRNSLQYLKLLFSYDLKRQRMKLGTQYDFLYPSEGSETLFFGNEFDWLHYSWIDIGTPNVSFLVALDAGSDLLWVPCDCIQCAPLTAGYYNMLDRDLSEYSPSLSSTSKHLPCGHHMCDMSSICKNPQDACPYIAKYYTENTSTSGFLVEDELQFASTNKHRTQYSVQASIIFGCGRKQSGGYLEGAAPDGVMGLGPGNISVPSLLAKAGLIRNSFSFCFNENGSGSILFGDQGVSTPHWTPFLPIDGKLATYLVGAESFCVGSSCLRQTTFQTVIDSGSSFTFLPNGVYRNVVSEFDTQMNATRVNLPQYPWSYCYNVSSKLSVRIPALKITFTNNQSFLIHNPMFKEPLDPESSIFCLTLAYTDDDYGIIGQNFMTGYRLVFDRENLQFGWSSSNCDDNFDKTTTHAPPPNDGSSNQLPTDEQQSIPNTHTMAPSVAGNTTSKPSVAAPQKFLSSLCSSSALLLLTLLNCLFTSP